MKCFVRHSVQTARPSSPGVEDQTAQLWQVSTTEPLGAALAHQGPVADVAFTPDGETVATASDDRDLPDLGRRDVPSARAGDASSRLR